MENTNQLIKTKLKGRTRRKLYNRYGTRGLKMLCMVYSYTRSRTLCIGRLKDVKMLCRSPYWTETQALRIIERSGLFVIDSEKDIIYSPEERIRNGFCVKPSVWEIKVVFESDGDILNFERTKHKKHVQHIR